MPPLHSDLRKSLEKAVIAAREEAQSAAAAALKRLAVASSNKDLPKYLSDPEKNLRRQLRAKARQLGDPWIADKELFTAIPKLTHEVAYEHWHRMLFARFLAENDLLVHPRHEVPVSLSDLAELAQEEAAALHTRADKWALAERFAALMLPQIFRPDDPALAVPLAPEHQQALESILESLPAATFTADDSLGWVYQFWQSAEKDRVNAQGKKITSDTVSAVTQLFTEHYMVLFLLHNTLGAWWAGKEIAKHENTKTGKREMQAWLTEADARAAVALPGLDWEYLRFVRSEITNHDSTIPNHESSFSPAASTFPGWPRNTKEIKLLDPCCGSGHFLVAALDILTRLRIAEENLSLRDAIDAVLRDNLHGLELDPRCTQIAAFNLALAAWKLGGGYWQLPTMHIACTGIAPQASQEQWLKLAEQSGLPMPKAGREPIRRGLLDLHELFSQAPTLGSLIDPNTLPAEGFAADYETILPYLESALTAEAKKGDDDVHERAVAAQGMVKAAEMLAGDYTLVVTNVPYLGRGKQDDTLKEHLEKHFAEGKADLATAFVMRCLDLCDKGATTALVTPQNWLFLTTYKKLRERLLRDQTWDVVARLGSGAFETIGGAVVNVALLALTRAEAAGDHAMLGLDGSTGKSATDKAALLRGESGEAGTPHADLRQLPQAGQRKNPDSTITLDAHVHQTLLGTLATCVEGLSTGDGEQFVMKFWELSDNSSVWEFFIQNVTTNQLYGGRTDIVRWEKTHGALHAFPTSHNFPSLEMNGYRVLGNIGLRITQMTDPKSTIYTGEIFGKSAGTFILRDPELLPAAWCYTTSEDFPEQVNKVNQALYKPVGTFLKVPFDLAHWQSVAAEKYPDGLPEPESDDPTQWLFHGRPEAAAAGSELQVAMARLLGYRWPAELEGFNEPRPSGSGAAGAKTGEPLPDGRGSSGMRLSRRARELVKRCDELLAFADDDGVVPVVPINQEPPADQRLRALLEASYSPPSQGGAGGGLGAREEGTHNQAVDATLPSYSPPSQGGAGGGLDQQRDRGHKEVVDTTLPRPLPKREGSMTPAKLADLIAAAGSSGGPGKSLEEWLRQDFFGQHCSMFHQRPFIWQIWDGRKDGFSVLVNYHQLAAPSGEGRRLLEKITYTYLGDWINQQKKAAAAGVAGADVRILAATELAAKLASIIAGEPPYDIFVRWKPLHQQPIGWEPDINDGVRLNIRPFIEAGVLRGKVNVNWKKDRGAEPQSLRPRKMFPWFWGWDEKAADFKGGAEFTGERFNALHYTNAVKLAARKQAKEEAWDAELEAAKTVKPKRK